MDLTDFENEELLNYEKLNDKKKKNKRDEEAQEPSKKNEPIRYQLISVVVHEGRSISSGHYIAHCRQPSGQWMTYDDEYINSISEKQVLKEPNAYYLIYTRLKHKDQSAKNKTGKHSLEPVAQQSGSNKRQRRA